MSHTAYRRDSHGFSLMELAIVLLISSLVVGTAITLSAGKSSTDECFLKTRDQLNTIQTAIQQYVTKNDRYPMPAKRAVGVDAPDFGREAAAADLTVSGGVTYGALPFAALGLPTEYAADCWDQKFTYAVTSAYTSASATGGYLDPAVNGAIAIKSDASNTQLADAAYAVISHGPDGLGAVKRNATAASWCTNSTDLKTENCDADDTSLLVAEFNDGKSAAGNYFDDVVVFKGRMEVAAATPVPPGTLFCWGVNGQGQLGDGTNSPKMVPTPVVLPAGVTGFTQVSANDHYSCALADTGQIYCWGMDSPNGRLGNGTPSTNRNTPTLVAPPSNPTAGFTGYTSLSVGRNHSCAIGNDTRVYCWGLNSSGQLGDGTATARFVPRLVSLPGNGMWSYSKVSVGSNHSCALGNDSQVNGDDNAIYCWGSNTSGQLGDGTAVASSNIPVKYDPSPHTIYAIRELSAGNTTTCILGVDSSFTEQIFCWGLNRFGEIGQAALPYGAGIFYNKPKLVDAAVAGGSYKSITNGYFHACGVGADNKLYCWGQQTPEGQLPIGADPASKNTPTATSPVITGFALRGDAGSTNRNGTCVLAATGRAYCSGLNDAGQIGDNTTTNSNILVAAQFPSGVSSYQSVAVGLSQHTCAISGSPLPSPAPTGCHGFWFWNGMNWDDYLDPSTSVPACPMPAPWTAGPTLIRCCDIPQWVLTGYSAAPESTCPVGDDFGYSYSASTITSSGSCKRDGGGVIVSESGDGCAGYQGEIPTVPCDAMGGSWDVGGCFNGISMSSDYECQ